jgi:hypothetical protein
MRVTVDNLDGTGAQDYTGRVSASTALVLKRTLNAPAECVFKVVLENGAAACPVRKARVVVSSDDGGVLFTGYVATEPLRSYAGTGTTGAAYEALVSAVSDEWLLDRQGLEVGKRAAVALSLDGRTLVQRLASDAGGALTVASSGGTVNTAGVFGVRDGEGWSASAGAASGACYASYRAVAGEVLVQPAGNVMHTFTDADGSLTPSAFALTDRSELANDVTVTGATEPCAYVTETFAGDGVTAEFALREAAFDTKLTLAKDVFAGPSFNSALWSVSDPGAHLGITSAGLTATGGTGSYGVTTLLARDAVELGATVVAEVSGVAVGALSDGMLASFYNGLLTPEGCFAGIRVRPDGSGNTLLAAVVNGAEVGTTFTLVAGHTYALRVRVHAVEAHRVSQRYYVMVDGVVEGFGLGSPAAAPCDVVVELTDEGAASNTPATVLYDSGAAGATLSAPATCAFAVVNAASFTGSVAAVRVTSSGPLWVRSVLASGAVQTRLSGVSGEGADFAVTTSAGVSKLVFFAGRIPVAGERVEVLYRTTQRSVARLQNAASVAAEALAGAPGTCRWLGSMLAPVARNSADCENAAAAVLAVATSRTAAERGTYAVVNPAADVWPGDVLVVVSEGASTTLLLRAVEVTCGSDGALRYKLDGANDWATQREDGLGLRLSESVAADATLPTVALDAPAAVLANLQALRVVSVMTTTLTLDMGVDPPAGGGFEVRRRDWDFGVGSDVDLVLRSPVRGFSIARAAQVESFFVRMYDASATRVYSRFSSVVVVHAPVA